MKDSSGVLLHAVVFDLDNCLIQSTIDFKKIKWHLLKVIREESPNAPASLSVVNLDVTDIQALSIAELLKHIKSFSPTLHQQALQFVEEEELKGSANPKPMPCSRELLIELRQLELKVGLLTNNNRTITSRVLNSLSWLDYFDLVVTRDDVTEMKPSPEGLQFFLEKWNLNQKALLYIGDSWIDETAALEAGVYFIGIKREWQPGPYHFHAGSSDALSKSTVIWLDTLCEVKRLFLPRNGQLFLRLKKKEDP